MTHPKKTENSILKKITNPNTDDWTEGMRIKITLNQELRIIRQRNTTMIFYDFARFTGDLISSHLSGLWCWRDCDDPRLMFLRLLGVWISHLPGRLKTIISRKSDVAGVFAVTFPLHSWLGLLVTLLLWLLAAVCPLRVRLTFYLII